MALALSVALGLALGASPVSAGPVNAKPAGGLDQIEHVVLFMQENRAFNHYFGTMAGVRGFNDPNVQVNSDGRSVWYQTVDKSLSTETDYLLPWYLNYLGGDWAQATQCMVAGSNGYDANHAALNGDLNNHWAIKNTPYSWGYFKRQDLPVHFAMAEGYTVNDMYQEGQMTATNPNRVTWVSGNINATGYPYIDNNETPGCESGATGPFSCYPLTWETTFEVYQRLNVTWQVWQDTNNFDDNANAWFQQYQNAPDNSPLHVHGNSFQYTLDDFAKAAAAGTLPQVSIIVGQTELSEHPPWQPKDGAWLHQQIFNAVVNSPKYHQTALFISYDETGGFGDAVTPFHSPSGTAGEWIQDPLGKFGQTYTGPGFRVPSWIVSPWTRGGRVFGEHCDHNSQILFVEKWLQAKGYSNVELKGMAPWRRENMCDFVNAFDFAHPDYSIPQVPTAAAPHTDSNGNFDGASLCEAAHPSTRPPVPYGKQTLQDSLYFENGFKKVVGYLTEGRYLTFELNGYALTNPGNGDKVTTTKATAAHDSKNQRWVIHASNGTFKISSALDGRFIGDHGKDGIQLGAASDAASFNISFEANSGYSIQYNGGKFLAVNPAGKVHAIASDKAQYDIYSVSYHN
ncbi:non-hemolytic phospholipase C precursor, putative [Talaromyces stipitatus ATCC 10500]|uniref:Non-hemolytic phospholipase C, putative n=1 Tax=Talaromyces stipitatus (strain ATCC 10500 / CBS 375.48 / QM 6759 / NRRL 1006) TaxID=441959 RepID=B8MDT1_TALSN|nr:non-hemolytic phospholipase C precursor, putative [Talaromyces stipitatus ATCC 10500]EED18310.1 non-hemolytic phospholipase C precursor, putative [Talaromyces stipitatus ATCC 10500]